MIKLCKIGIHNWHKKVITILTPHPRIKETEILEYKCKRCSKTKHKNIPFFNDGNISF
jgi:hypothetical protein